VSRQPLRRVSGPAVPLVRPNLDTDVIIRIDRMVSTSPADLAPFAFESLRVGADGRPDPATALNDLRFSGAPILIGGTNFGCGSSREPAVWALMGMGIRCVIAGSFGDIFEANCHQNGVLPVVLTDPGLSALAAIAADGTPVEVDLEAQRIVAGGSIWPFAIGAMQKVALLEGVDDIDLALRLSDDIEAWERRDRRQRPWAWPSLNASTPRST
jgi:3-isopropylmalate/(R)-2-methylmalate dehydratase small subunit